MVQLINGPTHRKLGLESTIDLIFTSEPRKIESSGTIATGSDHDCVWVVRKSKFVPIKQEFVKRTYRDFDKEKMFDEAREYPGTLKVNQLQMKRNLI